MYDYYTPVYDDELYHHGIKGQKWGVRRFQNINGTLTALGKKRLQNRQTRINKRIDTLYNRSNKWTERKIKKLDKKGKTAKADVMREMLRRNEKARFDQKTFVEGASHLKLNKSKVQDLLDLSFGGARWMESNAMHMTTTLSRLENYTRQRGIRWASNFTLNSTLARMTPEKGYDYLDRKHLAQVYVSNASKIGTTTVPKTDVDKLKKPKVYKV